MAPHSKIERRLHPKLWVVIAMLGVAGAAGISGHLGAPAWLAALVLIGTLALSAWQAWGVIASLTEEIRRLRKELIEKSQKLRAKRREIEALKGQAALAQHTQMLAHDVRKPLSLMKIAVGQISGASDPQAVRQVVEKFVPAVEKALADADRMIADVMEFGHQSDLLLEAVAPDALVESTVMSLFRIRKDCNIAFEYHFAHRYKVRVDSLKMLRVLANVVENAVEAMNGNGMIRFSTRELALSRPLTEIVIANSGTYIPPEDREKIFAPFFTKGKKGGTGLGLAIARKVIRAHGGTIHCESSRADGTLFRLTVPTADEPIARLIESLPAHSGEIQIALEAARRRSLGRAFGETGEDMAAMTSRVVSRARGRRLRVLLVDDHPLYMTTLNAQLMGIEGLDNELECFMASSGDEALEILVRERPDLIICDVDMGPRSPDGYEIVRRIRGLESGHRRAIICMHSNHKSPRDFDSAKAVGADGFLPKPMSQESLLKLLLAAIPEPDSEERAAHLEGAGATRRSGAVAKTRVEVALVDDCPFTLEGWELALKEVRTHSFSSPAEIIAKVEADAGFLASLSCVVTDFAFGGRMTGLDLAEWLKARRSDLPVLLSTDALFDGNPAVDRAIAKEPLPWDRLRRLLPARL